MPDHAPGSVALPVQDPVADLVSHADRHQREFLQDRNLASQPLQLPVGLNSNESWPTALLLGSGKEAVRWTRPWEGALTGWGPAGTHFVGQQEALDGSADDFQVCFSTNFKSVFLWGQELSAHFL